MENLIDILKARLKDDKEELKFAWKENKPLFAIEVFLLLLYVAIPIAYIIVTMMSWGWFGTYEQQADAWCLKMTLGVIGLAMLIFGKL